MDRWPFLSEVLASRPVNHPGRNSVLSLAAMVSCGLRENDLQGSSLKPAKPGVKGQGLQRAVSQGELKGREVEQLLSTPQQPPTPLGRQSHPAGRIGSDELATAVLTTDLTTEVDNANL
jgi:hypothetical protein